MARRGGRTVPQVTAVEVFVYRRRGGEVEWLLLKLPSGIWQPVTGKIGRGETPLRAARREAEEETGIRGLRAYPTHFADTFVDPQRGRVFHLPVFFAEAPPSATVRVSSEHVTFDWFGYDRAFEVLPYHGNREALLASDLARRVLESLGPIPGLGPRRPPQGPPNVEREYRR